MAKKNSATTRTQPEGKTQAENEKAIQNLNQAVQAIQDKLPQIELQHNSRLSQVEKQVDAIRKAMDKLQADMERLENRLNDQRSYSKGFYDGRQYIVSRAEQILCKQIGCRSREELATSGKIHSFWMSTLVLCLDDPPWVLNLAKEKEKNGGI